MPDLSEREKTLLKLIVKIEFFQCPKCEEEYRKANHDNHKFDIHATCDDIEHWFAYLNMSLIGKNLDFGFLRHNSGNLQLAIDELVTEGFLTPMNYPCNGCGGLVYVRTDTMKQPASVVFAEDGKTCRFA